MNKRVLITGYGGYVGPHLVNLLNEKGYYSVGVDLQIFRDGKWEKPPTPNEEWIDDFRSLKHLDLNFDTVFHLASISNDPMGEIDPDLTYQVNYLSTVKLAEEAKKAGVKNFIFASTCSCYGKNDQKALTEKDTLNPLTAYAKSKVLAEKRLSYLADSNFRVIKIRFATAFGYSPNLRFDLVANNLLGSALAYRQIRILSDGTPWRPLIHCKDMAKIMVLLSELPFADTGYDLTVNGGFNDMNYTVREIANAVKKLTPYAEISFGDKAAPDPRSYKVNFTKLAKLLPNYKREYDLLKGLKELKGRLEKRGFSKKEFESDRFTRIKTLKKRINLLYFSRNSCCIS